jgi:hypothetical protein
VNHDYCSNCGSQTEKLTCCWYQEGEADHLHPHPLIPGPSWEAWTADHRFLIALMMERFGGAAEERELLARLPWPVWRLVSCTYDPWGTWELSPLDHPCIRERHGALVRYFLTDMARHAYERYQREEQAAAAGFRPGFPFGSSRPATGTTLLEETR